MSYDVYLMINTGSRDVAIDDWNYTSNVGQMFRKAMNNGIIGLRGIGAVEAADRIKSAIEKMEGEPDTYRAMNPSNGWGDYDGALLFLRKIHDACVDNPKCFLEVSA